MTKDEEIARLKARVRNLKKQRSRLRSDVRDMQEYLEHGAWRCQYRTRYKKCHCGLDDLCDRLGIPRIDPDDPERS